MNRSIPTPSISEVSIGPFTVHFYALCIITGIAIAIWLGNKRLAAHDESLKAVVSEVAVIAVPSGIIGGRLYHVITTPEEFFGEGGDLLAIFKIWRCAGSFVLI
jgi:prolipoprotein diacylglyceryltransferase